MMRFELSQRQLGIVDILYDYQLHWTATKFGNRTTYPIPLYRCGAPPQIPDMSPGWEGGAVGWMVGWWDARMVGQSDGRRLGWWDARVVGHSIYIVASQHWFARHYDLSRIKKEPKFTIIQLDYV